MSYNQFSHVEDVYVYDKEGRLLEDVTLVDQRGVPIIMGGVGRCGDTREPVRYPQCPEFAPGPPGHFKYVVPSPKPSPSATG